MGNKTDNRKTLQNLGAQEKAQRKTELDAVRLLMSTPLGRFLAWRLMDACGVDRRAPFQPNAMQLAHDHGASAMGYFLLSEIREACPELELVMRHETQQRELRTELAVEAEDNDGSE